MRRLTTILGLLFTQSSAVLAQSTPERLAGAFDLLTDDPGQALSMYSEMINEFPVGTLRHNAARRGRMRAYLAILKADPSDQRTALAFRSGFPRDGAAFLPSEREELAAEFTVAPNNDFILEIRATQAYRVSGTNGVNLRAEASASSQIVGRVISGHVIYVVDKVPPADGIGRNWLQLPLGFGYVREDLADLLE